jgi:transposase
MADIERPSTPVRQEDMTRDERIEAQVYRGLGWTYKQIAERMGKSPRQEQTACTSPATPKKKCGRPATITITMRQELVAFVRASARNRLMPYAQIPEAIGWNVSEAQVRRALQKEGYARRSARLKPPISEANRIARLAWARAHVHWSEEEWGKILWTDETWVTGGRHTKVWVTRTAGEALEPFCVVERAGRKRGWMFWGSISLRKGKGPCVFWEKDWGTINKETYCAHTVPVIHGWVRMNPGMELMQDGAPGHSAEYTLDELRERGIRVISWPAYSPDLNPIETLWNRIKNELQEKYPEKMNYDQLRAAVKAIWDAIPDDDVRDLIRTMRQRCEAVIAANGLFTRF